MSLSSRENSSFFEIKKEHLKNSKTLLESKHKLFILLYSVKIEVYHKCIDIWSVNYI